jgi:hypothetical protein
MSLDLSDRDLLAECDVHVHRASGPGGQNRNKVESAVRLLHRPTGISVNAYESRSQHENRVRALKRLREALALRVRRPLDPGETVPPAISAVIGPDGRIKVGRRDQRYLPAAGALLDVLEACKGSVADAARLIGVTTGNLSGFLTDDDGVMTEANRIRGAHGIAPLRR